MPVELGATRDRKLTWWRKAAFSGGLGEDRALSGGEIYAGQALGHSPSRQEKSEGRYL